MWRDSIHHDGFAIIPEVFAQQEVDQLTNEIAILDLRRSRAGARHALRHRVVSELAHDQRLLEIARAVLGPSAFPFRATFFDKSPTSNWLVVWHQDTALPLKQRRDMTGWGPWSEKAGVLYAHAPSNALSQVLALRIHLDDSTTSNGPLRVLPRSHNLGVLSDGQVEQFASKTSAVECLVNRGGVIAMRPLIIHASSKSSSAEPRRVLHIEYSSSTTTSDGLELATA